MLVALKRRPLIAILAAALVLRIAAAVVVQWSLDREGADFLIPGDADGYWILAGKIAAGDEYSVYNPPRRVLRMPGFPLFLAAVRVVAGDSLFAARLALAGVGTAACAAVYLLGATLICRRTGLWAAAFAACWPALVGFSVLILSETLFALLLTLSLAAMARLLSMARAATHAPADGATAVSGPILTWAAIVGLSIVAAAHVRPTWLPAAGLFPIGYWLWMKRTRGAAVVAAVTMLTAAIALVPWTVRNRVATGHWVPTTLWVGPSLYDGLNPQATGASDMRFFDEQQLFLTLSEYEVDREYRRRAWKFVRDNPERAASLALAKLWRFWRPWPGAEQFSNPFACITVAGYYLPMLLLAIYGVWVRRRDIWLIALSAGPILLFAAVHCVFVASLRYRLPAEYPLCVLSAVGLQSLLAHRTAPVT